MLELVRQLAPARSGLSFALCLGTIAVPIFIGAVVICRRNAFSRTVSAATLLSLGVIALYFASFPSYLLPLALGVAYVGARPQLQRKPAGKTRLVLYSVAAVTTGLLVSFLVAYGVTVAARFIAAAYPL